MSQLSLMPAHVPGALMPQRQAVDVPLPFDAADAAPAEPVQGISQNARAVCSDAEAKANLALFLRRKCLFQHVVKKVARATGADARTVQNWLGERNLPDDDGRRRLVSAYGDAVLRIIYPGADPVLEAPL